MFDNNTPQDNSTSNVEVQESTDNTVDNSEKTVESQDNSSNPAQDTAQIEEKKAEIKRLKKLKLKVDGEELEEELPFEVEEKPEIVEYLKKQLQLAKMSHKRALQASTLEKEIGAFLQALKENPEEVLQDPNLGINLEDLAKRVIQKKIEESKKTPEQIEQEKIQKRLKELEEEVKQKEELIKQKEMERLQEKMFVEYNNSIETVLKDAKLPVNQYMKGKMADYMLLALKNGVDAKAEDVLPLVQKEIQRELKEMFEVMPTEVIEQVVGKDAIKKFNKTQPGSQTAKKSVTPATATKVQDTGGKKEENKTKEEKMKLNDFPLFKKLGI